MKRIIEKVIGLIKDTSAQVSESAKEVAIGLKDLCYDFSAVFNKLSSAYQHLFQEYCEQIRGSTILRGSFSRISEPANKFVMETPEKPKNLSFQSAGLNNIASSINISYLETKYNLVFGFIPSALIQQLEDQEN